LDANVSVRRGSGTPRGSTDDSGTSPVRLSLTGPDPQAEDSDRHVSTLVIKTQSQRRGTGSLSSSVDCCYSNLLDLLRVKTRVCSYNLYATPFLSLVSHLTLVKFILKRTQSVCTREKEREKERKKREKMKFFILFFELFFFFLLCFFPLVRASGYVSSYTEVHS
jgi:hypothetical protein